MSDKMSVCLRNFDGAICQKCGTIVTQEDINKGSCWRIEKVIAEVIDEVNEEVALKRKKRPLLVKLFKRTGSRQ